MVPQENDEKKEDVSGDAAGEASQGEPLKDITNTNSDEAKGDKDDKKKQQNRPQRERRERGPPADGIPSKTKVMVANLPYDLTEEKVSCLPPMLVRLRAK